MSKIRVIVSTANRVNPDRYTYIHTLVQGEIKDLLLGMTDQSRSILQKEEGDRYPYEAVRVAEKATKGIISNS
ncbi:hypothetical protein NC652_029260 [Populus alba x Populus x berolinensis]|nr:hypothetical protein NC652_029260 [Populus alba x Populus x berolinensis]